MSDFPDAALFDELPGQPQRRGPPIVEADEGLDTATRRSVCGLCHLLSFGLRVGKGFLAQDVLASLERSDRDLRVCVTGSADVNDIDLGVGDYVTPVGDDSCNVEPFGEPCGGGRVAAADGGHFDPGPDVEEPPRSEPGLRVDRSHEGVADDGHTER